jgi:hypothetical protein
MHQKQHFTDMKASGVGTTELNRDISDKLNATAAAHRYTANTVNTILYCTEHSKQTYKLYRASNTGNTAIFMTSTPALATNLRAS